MVGTGEIAPLPGLSLENDEQVEQELASVTRLLENADVSLTSEVEELESRFHLKKFSSSLRFGVVMALLDLYHGGVRKIFDSPFFNGQPVPINGLVWMADMESMLNQARIKISDGFDCIKFKVGGLDFEEECRMLNRIRSDFPSEILTIRLDANGAFGTKDVHHKLERLAMYTIHSIEQPVKPREWLMNPELLLDSPIPVALDEQLIGHFSLEQKRDLMSILKPSFLVLKPGLIGGFSETNQWIELAVEQNINWWLTSSLESPVGLNALAQFVSLYDPSIPQGLGTGQIFDDLFSHPLIVKDGKIWLNALKKWGF